MTPCFKQLLTVGFCILELTSRASAVESPFTLSLNDAEKRALASSFQLKALDAVANAASEHAESQFSLLWPRLSFDAGFQYNTHVPTLNLPIPGATGIAFGDHYAYSYGPTLSYTVFDYGAVRNSFKGFDLLAQSRQNDKRNAERQVLFSVRSAYLRLQLALEELRLLTSTLDLARGQNRDIEANFRGGAATRLDRVDSQREVLNYELQMTQKKAEVTADFKDLLAAIQEPEPAGTLLMPKLDPLPRTLSEAETWTFAPPDEAEPSLRALRNLADSSDRLAESQRGSYFPKLQISASAKMQYPDQINLEVVEQNTLMATLTMPLFEGNLTHHQMAESRLQAQSARFNEAQMKINLERDYSKAVAQLNSLRTQANLAAADVKRSEDAARLYGQSYKGGKINLIDVQGANNRALVSKVNAARIGAQLLNQIFLLQSISGEAAHNGK